MYSWNLCVTLSPYTFNAAAMEEEDDRGLWGIKFKLPWFDNPKK